MTSVNDTTHEETESFQVTLSDARGGAGIVRGTAVVTIQDDDPAETSEPTPPPGVGFAEGVLSVFGTPDDDVIRIVKIGTRYQLQVNGESYPLAEWSQMVQVEVDAADGDDLVDLRRLPRTKAAVVWGGAGSDTIHGGSGPDVLRGDEDDDRLYGRAGHDVLLGGDGRDRISASSGDDLLIGGADADILSGSTGADLLLGGIVNDEDEELDLQEILFEWRETQDAELIEPLLEFYEDDEERDVLRGNAGPDWFTADGPTEVLDRTAEDQLQLPLL